MARKANIAALLALAGGAWGPACDVESTTEPETMEQESLSCDPISGQELFDRRIAPLLGDDRPSSCNECHLTGLDLGSFARETPCRTMACMAEQGLVNLNQPEDSLVLSWIARADPSLAGSELVTEETIADEYDAVLQWIEYTARCGDTACSPIANPCGAEPTYEDCELAGVPLEEREFNDPGDCSEATLEGLFAARVYSWRGRCFPCHFEDSEIETGAPRWIKVGSCEVGATRTMHTLMDWQLLDATQPAESLLLLKPLPEESGGVYHEGHHKFANTEDQAYLDFLYWIERYSACQP